MYSVVQIGQPAFCFRRKHLRSCAEKHFTAGKFKEDFLLVDDGVVFASNAPQCIEIVWREDDFAQQDARVQKTRLVDHIDLRGQAFDPAQQRL